MQLMQRQLRPGFAAASQPLRGRPWVARLFDLPPLGELRARLIAFGGLRPERVRDLAPTPAPAWRRMAGLARATGALLLSALAKVDARYWMCVGGVFWPPTQATDGDR